LHRLTLTLLFLFALPVVAAVYYGGLTNPLWIVSSLLSVCALAFSIPVALRISPGSRISLSTTLMLVTLVGIYLASLFLSYYLQGSYLNRQFFLQLNLDTLIQTWNVFSSLFFIFLVWMAALLACVWFFRHHAGGHEASLYTLVGICSIALLFDPGLRQAMGNAMRTDNYTFIQDIADIDWESLGFNQAAIEASPIEATPGKNLVLIYLEGLEKHYLDESRFPELTPNLHRLNAEGLQLDEFFPVEGSMWTMGGLVSTLCGTPLESQSLMGGNQIMFSNFLDKAICLPDVLDQAGYQQVYVGGATLGFAGKGNFFETHSYDRVLGKEELETSLPDPGYQGKWGLFDDSLFEFALVEFAELATSSEPFNLTLLTVDTHQPVEERSASCRPYPYPHLDNDMLHAVHCTDFLLGAFIEQLKTFEAYEDTLVVITSDHLTMGTNAWSDFPDDDERTLYFNVLNSDVSSMPAGEVRPMDLAPSILHLLGVEHNAPFLAGENLFEPPAERNTYDPDHPYSRAAFAYLNSEYLSSGDSYVLYSTDLDGLEGIQFSEHITDIEYEDGELSFTASGNDPHLILPPVEIPSPEDATMFLYLEMEQDSVSAVYYSEDVNPEFSEEKTILLNSYRGENSHAFALNNLNSNSRIRLDPGVHPGRYVIRLLEIGS
jgi:arylsulfatase A-like enzyme